jgi:hypothetical protein
LIQPPPKSKPFHSQKSINNLYLSLNQVSPSSVEKDNMLNKVKPVLRGHLLGNNKMALQDR